MLGQDPKRLVISKIVQVNFKSYAGTIEIGPFHKSFTSVVGPNGSGKSNVIDSLLFVFGFKAKKLRQSKLSDLIHNSSAHPNLTSCQVQVHFEEIVDREDGYDVVPDSHFVVSRTVEKKVVMDKVSDKSTYFVNGVATTYTDVQTLLKGYGVDLDHKRFLILQGEVESIALMKPKGQGEHEDGLLEYLEDIIGTATLKEPIQHAEIKLQELMDRKDEKLEHLKLIQKETKSLEAQSKEIIDYIGSENNISHLKNRIFQVERKKTIELIQESLQAKEAAELKIASEKERQVQLTTDADQYGKKLSEFEKEMGGLADEIAGLKKVVQSLEKSEIEAKETEKFLVQKSKKLKKTLKQDTLQQSEDETWIENFAEDVDQSQTKVDELSKKLKTEESKLTEIQLELQGKTQIYQTQISAKQVELEPLIEKCNSLKSKIDVLQSEKDLLNKKMQELSAVCESSKAKYAELLDCLDAKRAQQSEKKTDIKALNDAVQFKAADLSSLKSSREKLKIELKEVNEKMHDFKSNFESSLSRGKVHAELMKQKKQGKIKGICGRLGDLGYIDDKYDIAISTACGALDSIVVETVKDGQDCIEFLKHSNIGRATFICLDKLQKFNMDPISTPEKVARLFDLIKPNESRFLPAFYHGVSDTLVANDLQQANRVAYGKTRFRVVTLDGQLIDKSGTMSGGGSKPQKGGMNSKKAAFKDSGSNLVELETAQQDLSSKIDHVNNKIKAEEQTLKDQEKECKQAKNELKKLDLDINSLDLEIQDAKKAIEMAEQNSSPDSRDLRRISDLEKEIAKLLDLYSATEPSMIMGQQEISDLEEKILDIGGVRLRSQQSMVDGLKEQIQSFTEKVAKLLAEKSIRQKSLKKLLDAINKKTEELDQVEKQLDEFQSTTRDRFRELETERDRLKEMEEEWESKSEGLSELKLNLQRATEELNELRSGQVQLRAQLASASQNHASYQSRVHQIESALKKLTIQTTGFESEEVDISLPTFTDKEIDSMNLKELQKELESLEETLDGAQPNFDILSEYKTKLQIYRERTEALEMATMKRDKVKLEYDMLKKKRLDMFMEGFTLISQKLKEMYQMITMGGNAELELVDSMDPFSEGIVFSVMVLEINQAAKKKLEKYCQFIRRGEDT